MRNGIKGFIGVLMIGILVGSAQPAKADNVITILKDYGIPCGIAMGASYFLTSSISAGDSLGIGAAICLGISSATYLNSTRKAQVNPEDLKMTVDASVAESESKMTASLEDKVAQLNKHQDEEFEKMRVLSRDLLADRLVKMEDDVKKLIEQRISAGDFMPALEQRLLAKIREEVLGESHLRMKEVVDKCVDETIKEVQGKRIATPDDGK